MHSVQQMGQEPTPQMILGNVARFFIHILLLAMISLGSLIFYIMHAIQNLNLEGKTLLIVWIVLFVLIGGVGQLIYWVVEILGKKNTEIES